MILLKTKNNFLLKGVALIIIAITFFSLTVFAESSQITTTFNGNSINLSRPPVLEDGTVFLPAEDIFGALDAFDVNWLEHSGVLVASRRLTTAAFSFGSNVILKNGQKINVDYPPRVISNTAYISMDTLEKAFDVKCTWNSKNNTVSISTKPQQYTVTCLQATASYKSEDGGPVLLEVKSMYPQIDNPKDDKVISKVNAVIKSNADKYLLQSKNKHFKAAESAYASSLYEERYFSAFSCERWFDVTYCSNNIISIKFESMEKTASGEPIVTAYAQSFNLATGKELSVTDVMNGTKASVNAEIEKAVFNELDKNPSSYSPEAKLVIKRAISKGVVFYVSEDGVVVCFESGAISNETYGIIEFVVNAGRV